jgi:hypothetical protein
MGLHETDLITNNLSLVQAYECIQRWYSQNLQLLPQKCHNRKYCIKSEVLIRSLPSVTELNTIEIRAILSEVIAGYLEWAYHETDGKCKMSDYAYGALKNYTSGAHKTRRKGLFTKKEFKQLMKSQLWPLLHIYSRYEEGIQHKNP